MNFIFIFVELMCSSVMLLLFVFVVGVFGIGIIEFLLMGLLFVIVDGVYVLIF